MDPRRVTHREEQHQGPCKAFVFILSLDAQLDFLRSWLGLYENKKKTFAWSVISAMRLDDTPKGQFLLSI